MPLLEPVALVPAADLGPVHFIAIGGSGMNGIASMFLELGLPVSGSDRQESAYLSALRARGARVHVGHRAEQLGDARTVVASSAIREVASSRQAETAGRRCCSPPTPIRAASSSGVSTASN